MKYEGKSGDILVNHNGEFYWINEVLYNECVDKSMKVLKEELDKVVKQRYETLKQRTVGL